MVAFHYLVDSTHLTPQLYVSYFKEMILAHWHRRVTHFEIVFAVSETSQPAARISTAFLFQSSVFPEPLPGIRTLFFLDHLVSVTRSSTCTSLTSGLEECMLCNSTMGRMGLDGENDDSRLGDEW